MENTSGQGKNTAVPPEVKGLAWGAFFWNFIWGIFNRTWIALLSLIPVVNLVMAFVLLFKGREWAWRNKRWDSVEHFNKIQRRWAIAGLIVILIPFIIFLILGFGFIVTFFGMMFGMQSAMDGAMKDVGKPKPEISVPATSPVKKPEPPIAAPAPILAPAQNAAPAASKSGSPDADFDSLLGPALTGFEKPGTTRAGPAILELSQFMGDSIWVKLHLPLIKDLDIAPAPEIIITSVLNASGQNYYDSASSFEAEFFRRVGISRDSNPAPHFSGLRTVRIKPGMNEQTLQKIEGQVHIAIPVDIKTVTFDASDIGKEKPVPGGTVALKSLSGTKAVLHYQNNTSKNMFGGVRGYDNGGTLVDIKMRQGSASGTQIDFNGPVNKIEILSANNVVQQQFPFTLVRGALAGPSLPATVGAKPSVLVPPAAASVATSPAIAAKPEARLMTPDELKKFNAMFEKNTKGGAVAGSPSPAAAGAKPSATTPGVAAAAATDPKALAKSPRDVDSTVKKPTSRPKWHAPTDLRHCLDLPSNAAIAKCAGE